MVDAHCHLNFHTFEKDVDKVIQEALDSGVKAIINVGTQIDSSKKTINLAEKYKNIYAAVGVHPHHTDKLNNNDWLKELENLAKHKKVVAIGEIGLDYFSYKSNGITDPILQKKLFIQQIELAYRLKLPLQIHNRHAEKDIADILDNHKLYLLSPPGMIHCFSGSLDFLRKVLDLGFYIGFDGNITYKGVAPGETTSLLDLAKYTPVEKILTETDSPYLSPIPFRGLRNTPKNVIIVKEFLASLKNFDAEKFQTQIDNNFERVFKVEL